MAYEINLTPGMEYMVQKKVAFHDTTVSFGRPEIEMILSSPSLISMMIEACVHLIGKNIPEGTISVVRNLQLTHEKPTLQGMVVTVKAIIDKIDNNIIMFDLVCFDEIGQIARGRMERHIVNREELVKRAKNRTEILGYK